MENWEDVPVDYLVVPLYREAPSEREQEIEGYVFAILAFLAVVVPVLAVLL